MATSSLDAYKKRAEDAEKKIEELELKLLLYQQKEGEINTNNTTTNNTQIDDDLYQNELQLKVEEYKKDSMTSNPNRIPFNPYTFEKILKTKIKRKFTIKSNMDHVPSGVDLYDVLHGQYDDDINNVKCYQFSTAHNIITNIFVCFFWSLILLLIFGNVFLSLIFANLLHVKLLIEFRIYFNVAIIFILMFILMYYTKWYEYNVDETKQCLKNESNQTSIQENIKAQHQCKPNIYFRIKHWNNERHFDRINDRMQYYQEVTHEAAMNYTFNSWIDTSSNLMLNEFPFTKLTIFKQIFFSDEKTKNDFIEETIKFCQDNMEYFNGRHKEIEYGMELIDYKKYSLIKSQTKTTYLNSGCYLLWYILLCPVCYRSYFASKTGAKHHVIQKEISL